MIGFERHDQDEETSKTDPPPGRTYLFNLHTDPQELHHLAGKAAHVAVEASLRATLIRELDGREEGFVRDGALAVLRGSTPT